MFVFTFDIELWSLTYIRREADPFFFVYYIRSCGIVCVCVLSAYPSIEFAELGLHRGEKQVHLSQCISLDVRYCLWVFVYVLSAYPFIEFMELGLHRGEEENS